MPAPKHYIAAHTPLDDTQTKKGEQPGTNPTNRPDAYTKPTLQRNPGWTVAFIRFLEPASLYVSNKGIRPTKTDSKMVIIENDCISVSVNRPKGAFLKSCSLTFKTTDVWYKNLISTGDHVVVWINEWQDESTGVAKTLAGLPGGIPLNSTFSGLRFVGRVTDCGALDAVSASGQRSPTHTIHCQAFAELSTSIYYSYLAQAALTSEGLTGVTDSLKTQALRQAHMLGLNQINSATSKSVAKKGGAVENFAEKFLSLYNSNAQWTPDRIIGIMFRLMMGMDKEKNEVNKLGFLGSPNNAIIIPKQLATIMGKPGATKLWETYNVILGIQKYAASKGNLGQRFFPITPDSDGVFYICSSPCSGFVPFYPPKWDNEVIWSVLGQYLNPVVNEMYTALRLNKQGHVVPTLIIREKPFSTGLQQYLEMTQAKMDKMEKATTESQKKIQKKAKETQTEVNEGAASISNKLKESGLNDYGFTDQAKIAKNTTYYANLPRWVIDESVIQSVSVQTSEANRINFVQVWGRSASAEFVGVDPGLLEGLKQSQFLSGNWVADQADIERHGLRAYIDESQFDVIQTGKGGAGSLAPQWAKKVADWRFNGHLKTYGTITYFGTNDPICEGDNVQVRGVVYHIDGVNISASIGANGQKSFMISLQVSNGILASSLETDRQVPMYPIHEGIYRDSAGVIAPGKTEVQRRDSGYTRDNTGLVGEKQKDHDE